MKLGGFRFEGFRAKGFWNWDSGCFHRVCKVRVGGLGFRVEGLGFRGLVGEHAVNGDS